MKTVLRAAALLFLAVLLNAEIKEKPGFFALYGWGGELSGCMEDIEKTGIKWLRVGGPVPSAKTDKCLLDAAKKGIHCVPVLANKEAAKKNDMKAWRETVREAVTRYGAGGVLWKENPSVPPVPVEYVEIWNEPNIEFLEPPEGMLRDEIYYNLLKNAYEEIKAVNKDIQVIAFNTAGGTIIKSNGPPVDGMFQKLKYFGWLKLITEVHKRGGGKYYDALGVHPYTTPNSPEKFKLVESIERIRKEMRENGSGEKPVWFTEVGFPLVYPNKGNVKDEDEQADFLLRLWGLSAAHGVTQVQIMYVTDIIYGPDNSKRAFGFFDNGRWRKQAASTKVMLDLLGDPPVLLNIIAEGLEGFYAYEFKGKTGKKVIMAWSSNKGSEERELKFSGAGAVLIDKMGNKKPEAAQNGKIKIRVSESPQFIVE